MINARSAREAAFRGGGSARIMQIARTREADPDGAVTVDIGVAGTYVS